MLDGGESRKEVIRPDFNRAIMIDFQGAKITSDVGFLLMREIDDRFKIIAPMGDCLEDLRSPTPTKHSLVQMIRQRVYQIGASYEDGNDADFLRIDPALRLALGKDHQAGAGQSRLSRLENDILGNEAGLQALEAALTRSTDTLLKRKNKKRLIIDLDSTEAPRQAGRGCLQWPFCQELLPSAFLLYQRGRLSEGKAEAGKSPFRRRHSTIYHSPGGALPALVPALLAA
jgi:hypothetical protein